MIESKLKAIFVFGPLHHHVLQFSFLGAVGLFRSDMLLIFYMVWPWFSCGTVCVCPQLPYRGNDMVIWIFPAIVPCHAFCLRHWPIGKDLDLSFIWGHHHLSEYMDISRPSENFIACYTVLTRPNKVETAVHGCNSWLSVWTLSCRCPVKLSTWYQPCIVCYSVYFWLIRSFTDPTFIGSIFVCGPLHHHVPNRFSVWVIPRFAFE